MPRLGAWRRSRDFYKWAAVAAILGFYWWRSRESDQRLLGWRSRDLIEEFKKRVFPIASIVEAETGIKAALGVTQAALEARYGASALSKPEASLDVYISGKAVRRGPAMNIFGLKAGEAWIRSGKAYVLVPTVDYYRAGQKMPNGQIAQKDGQALKWPAAFRAYASWEESYRDWARLMQTADYIADGALDALQAGNMAAFGRALSRRYAPNQGYEVRLAARAREMGVA